MTRLFNDAADFADQSIDGFVAAHRRWVRRVPGGVARNTSTPPGRVAVVIGGGSGHYPAFAGLVGQGLADGAVMGNVFASPSAAQVVSVATAAQHGGGVLLTYGNYAGDVLNFSQAEERLNGQGVPCRSLPVTDDIYSAPPTDRGKRRGVAGDLVVFKIAAAAAAQGRSLDEVAAVAARANDRTRTLGVAFTGCTLPGAAAPLFTVPAGRMAVGLGIHGEPGLDEVDIPTADGLAELFVSKLLGELPDGVHAPEGQRVTAVLNGLGAVKYEELFVVYGRVNQLLADAGIDVIDPVVGEVCTSFDMAGASLTLTWLDDELEPLWTAPADAPAFRVGAVESAPIAGPGIAEPVVTQAALAPTTRESRAAAARVVQLLEAVRACVDEHADELGRIDSVAGDGDHGIGMQRGSKAAAAAAHEAYTAGAGAGTVLTSAADAWADRAGGTSGALWGVALRRLGARIGDQDKPSAAAIAEGVHAARTGICDFGGAEVGDKTLVDVLVPFDEHLTAAVQQGSSLTGAMQTATAAAEQAAEATTHLLPRRGRARPHAERSLGTPDPGAVSLSLIVRTIHDNLANPRPVSDIPTSTDHRDPA
jgi:dihydroxyacetone kinase